MTNPIAKAIAKIGVAMGYGSLEDYKGSSVEDILESFASIAQEKGGSGGGSEVIDAVINVNNGTITVPLDLSTLATKLRNGAIIRAGLPNLPEPYYINQLMFPAMITKQTGSGADLTEIILFTCGDGGLIMYSISETTADSVVFEMMN